MKTYRYDALAAPTGAGDAAAVKTRLLGMPSNRGDIQALDEAGALAALQQQGLTVLALREVGGQAATDFTGQDSAAVATGMPGFLSARRVPTAVLAVVLYELATLVEAGVPLASALANLADAQVQNKPGSVLAKALVQLHQEVRSGVMFSRALANSAVDGGDLAAGADGSGLNTAQGVLPWPTFLLQLARAGEVTGNLAASLKSAASQMEQDEAFATEARNALIYPVVLVLSGLAATLLVFIFVVPKFASVLNNPKADIPAFSLAVLNVGMWMAQHKLALAVVGIAGTLLAGWAAQQRQLRQAVWDAAYNLPGVRLWVQQAELARWAAMLAVMLANTVPILQALGLARNTLKLSALRTQADLMRADVVGGKALSMAMRARNFADATSINLIAVGEKSGALAQTTQALAQMHRNASQARLKKFLVLLEPITILVISVVLGTVMISVMLAVTSLTNVL